MGVKAQLSMETLMEIEAHELGPFVGWSEIVGFPAQPACKHGRGR